MKEPGYSGLGPVVMKDLIPALHIGQFIQYRGKIQQTEKSSLSVVHTTSQCLLLAEIHLVISLF